MCSVCVHLMFLMFYITGLIHVKKYAVYINKNKFNDDAQQLQQSDLLHSTMISTQRFQIPF